MKKYQKGEIATLLTLGTFLIIGVVSLISSSLLNKPLTTGTHAQAACDSSLWNCAGECADQNTRNLFIAQFGAANASSNWQQQKAGNCGISVDQCSVATNCAPIATPTTSGSSSTVTPTQGSSTDTSHPDLKSNGWNCFCDNGKSSSDYWCGSTNPCGPIPENNAAPDNSPNCSSYGAWSNICTNSSQSCPANAGGTYTYWCDGAKWRFQYPNCVTWCQQDYINKPPSTKDPLCQNLNPGDPIPNFDDSKLPYNTILGSNTSPKSLPNKYVSCDGNQGVYVDVHPFCDQFGQVQWGPGGATGESCVPPNNSGTQGTGSFYIQANVTATQTSKGVDFSTEAAITSSDCDGDLSLDRDGNQVAISGWNRNVQGPTFTFPKEFGGTVSVPTGSTQPVSFGARLNKCPRSKTTLSASVSCQFGVSPYNIPWVRGGGCNLVNFNDVQKMTALSTPITQPRPTWAAPPPIKGKTSTVVFGSNTGNNCAPVACPENSQFYAESNGGAMYYQGTRNGQTKYFIQAANCTNLSSPGKATLPEVCGKITSTIAPQAPQGNQSNSGGSLAPQVVIGKCMDSRTNAVMSCPSTDKSNSSFIKYINCGTTGVQTEACQIFCVSVNDAKIRAECYGGEFTDSRLLWGPADFNVSVINASTATVRLKSLYIQTYGLGGTGKDKTDTVNMDLVPGQVVQRTEANIACQDEWTRGGRTVVATFTRTGKNTDDTVTIQVGCDSRPVVSITD